MRFQLCAPFSYNYYLNTSKFCDLHIKFNDEIHLMINSSAAVKEHLQEYFSRSCQALGVQTFDLNLCLLCIQCFEVSLNGTHYYKLVYEYLRVDCITTYRMPCQEMFLELYLRQTSKLFLKI